MAKDYQILGGKSKTGKVDQNKQKQRNLEETEALHEGKINLKKTDYNSFRERRSSTSIKGFPGGKELASVGDARDVHLLDPWVRKIP